MGVGRLILEDLLEQLPFDWIYLTSTAGNEPFYGKFGFGRSKPISHRALHAETH